MQKCVLNGLQIEIDETGCTVKDVVDTHGLGLRQELPIDINEACVEALQNS